MPTPVQATETKSKTDNPAVTTSGSLLPEIKDDQDARDFFCATREDYQGPAGSIHTLKASDWENPHRRRHLDNFAKSTVQWKNAGEEQKVRILNTDGAQLWAKDLIEWPKKLDDRQALDQTFAQLRKKHRCTPPVSDIVRCYRQYPTAHRNSRLEGLLLKKAVRSMSGVSVITVLTAPGEFSCAFDCAYCPNEPGQPRSYLSTEPAVMRANQNEWDACRQFWDRATTLHDNGHTVDKLEVLVLGGTWSGYPEDYQEGFIRDLFYAANVLPKVIKNLSEGKEATNGLRERKDIKEEQIINEFSREFHNEHEDMASWERVPRIIGLTLETRPDQITRREIHRLRYLGTTRVQMGVQHTNDKILTKIRRQCPIEVTRKALAMLKNSCFKVDIHLMPDLPGASPSIDRSMFELVLSSPDLQADQWKVYPCEVTPFSSIEDWYAAPKNASTHYAPYADIDGGRVLVNVLAAMKRAVHPWIRLNRVIRDIPEVTIIGGNNRTNLRQILADIMGSCGWDCRCMRCREVREKEIPSDQIALKIRRYEGDHGHHEYFISYESHDEKTLFAFLRLRVRKDANCGQTSKSCLPEMNDKYWNETNPASRMDGVTFMDEQKRKSFVQNVNKVKAREQRDARKRLGANVESTKQKVMDKNYEVFPELTPGVGLIRELHVYGQIVATGEQQYDESDMRAQHRGFGKMLLAVAERVAFQHGCYGLAVIAGIGVRGYYRKQGFVFDCLGSGHNDLDNAHFAYYPDHMNIDNPLEDSRYPRMPRGEFLMKYIEDWDNLQYLREHLELPVCLEIQEYNCETHLPILDEYDLEKAAKDKVAYAKRSRELKKAKSKMSKKNPKGTERLEASKKEHFDNPPPEIGDEKFDEIYKLFPDGQSKSPDKVQFSHSKSSSYIRWNSKVRGLWIPAALEQYISESIRPELVGVGVTALAGSAIALGSYFAFRKSKSE